MSQLLDEADSLLCVIDVQPGFLDKLTATHATDTVARIRWFTEVAVALQLPVLATEEEPQVHGATVEEVHGVLPPQTTVVDKSSFGLAGQPDLLEFVQRTGRQTLVVCGLETDVCVAQSALGLLDAGYRVAVPADAVASPGTAHEYGLARLRDAGVVISSVKGIAYEWLRTVQRTSELDAVLSRDVPPGVIL
jgi:nicotinamidase-related amidase